jgi:peptidoglycan hydrolase-like protein with peptidoglycan-binding domain
MSGVKLAGVLVALSAGVSGCAFDPASTTNDDVAETSSDIDIAAMPTCNSVASFHEAWVPYYNGTPSTVDCNMARGYNSAAVQQLQRTLNLCYHEHLAEDGNFDGATETALRRAQRKAGTTPDGQYGRETRKVILHESTSGGRCVHVP